MDEIAIDECTTLLYRGIDVFFIARYIGNTLCMQAYAKKTVHEIRTSIVIIHVSYKNKIDKKCQAEIGVRAFYYLEII